MPKATPRGTDRRVNRHSSETNMRWAIGLRYLLRSIAARVGIFLCTQWNIDMINRAAKSLSRILGLWSSMFAHQPALLPFPVTILFGLALVRCFLALRQRQFQLRLALAVEIDRQRHNRHPLAHHGRI